MFNKITYQARRRAHRHIAWGYIIKSRPGFLETLADRARDFELPTLLGRERIFFNELRNIVPFGTLGAGLKVFPRFDMIAGIFPRDAVFDMVDWPSVERIYSDEPVFISRFPVVSEEGVFRYMRKVRKPIDFTTTYYVRKLMGADIAESMGYDGNGIIVGIVDTGSRRTHEQLRGKVQFDTVLIAQHEDVNGHGSWVATCIAGREEIDGMLSRQIGRTIRCKGFAPEAFIYTVKALGYAIGTGSTSGIIEAVQNTLNYGVDLINLSLGGECKYKTLDEDPMYDVFNEVIKEGAIPVVAAGNSGPEANTIESPAWLPNVISVAAIDPIKGTVADFSSRGPTNDGRVAPTVAGYGVNIHSGIAGQLDYAGDNEPNRYSPISGTSMATPTVTGMLTLMKQAFREVVGSEFGFNEVMDMMKSTARHNKSNDFGWGLVTWQRFEEWLKIRYGVKV